MSALGGDGANAAGKLLFQIAVDRLNLDGAFDSKYGSEKTGTPTDVSLRLCPLGTPVRESGPTVRPHILGIYRENLITRLKLNRGLQPNAHVLVNTERTPDEIYEELQLNSGTITVLPATRIVTETGSRLNIAMLGVVAQALQFPLDAVRDVLAKIWPAAKDKNLAALDKGIESATSKQFADTGRFPLVAPDVPRGAIGYKNMLNGGAIDARSWLSSEMAPFPGTGSLPVFHREYCTDCGLCLVVCSDPGALIWKDKKMVGIGEVYCKGCLRCVEVCPSTKRGKALEPGLKPVAEAAPAVATSAVSR